MRKSVEILSSEKREIIERKVTNDNNIFGTTFEGTMIYFSGKINRF
jgi:hypothetical protein